MPAAFLVRFEVGSILGRRKSFPWPADRRPGRPTGGLAVPGQCMASRPPPGAPPVPGRAGRGGPWPPAMWSCGRC